MPDLPPPPHDLHVYVILFLLKFTLRGTFSDHVSHGGGSQINKCSQGGVTLGRTQSRPPSVSNRSSRGLVTSGVRWSRRGTRRKVAFSC
jgi:hypothetical protein